ncbi:Ubiquitin-conjugating enzyme [Carpediemonas membranifera]|uniref:Ubiquitin-conjugating enzyme n=1 Tax=Carpediemonas membranifera TaxID=201153 RepID=A0A8J6B584_9EUKA|nr:Ubiquitin-conjugating enzyme [Carpediemonas membranifera]|eukprot:KAG9395928.1 Ubiquitin-conjugating enzyme [Carpediemonas membranifera]
MFGKMTNTDARIVKDWKRFQADPPPGVEAEIDVNHIRNWKAVILGPEDSIWQGAVLLLSIDFPDNYPTKPPHVKFVSSVFHPNIYKSGEICLDILQNNWTSVYDVAAVLTSIQSLLTDPNPASPANIEAAQLFTKDEPAYERRVRKCIEAGWAAGDWE